MNKAGQQSSVRRGKRELRRRPLRRDKLYSGGWVAIGFFALFWTAIVMVFNGFIGYGVYKNYQAQDYLETTGVVTRSEVDRHRGSDSTTYSPDIEYRYEVDGQTYTSDQHVYGEISSSDRAGAKKAVRKFPVGKSVRVYYNPADPEDAVLDRSFESLPWFLVLFLTPFNLVMIGLWWACACGIWRSLFGKPEGTVGGCEIVHDGFATRVQIGRSHPMIAAGVGIGIVSFISIFILAFAGLTNNFVALGGTVLLMAVAGIVGAIWQVNRNNSGKGDLVLDRSNMKMIVPARFLGSPTELNLMELNSVGVKRVQGNKNSVHYAPTVTYVDENQIRQEVIICQWNQEAAANELATWLRQELGLQVHG